MNAFVKTKSYLNQRDDKKHFLLIEACTKDKDFPFLNDAIIGNFKILIDHMKGYTSITKLHQGLYRNYKKGDVPIKAQKAHYLKRKAIANDGYYKNLLALFKIANCHNIIPMFITLLYKHHITERQFTLYFPEFTKNLITAAESLKEG